MNNIKVVSAKQAKIVYYYKITYTAQQAMQEKLHYESRLRLDVCIQ
jgi:hypothetical protein